MESDDEDLERAIQLSLLTQPKHVRKTEDVIDLTEDEEVWPGFTDVEDMAFWKAITESLGRGTPS
jgi:hypothetical protein